MKSVGRWGFVAVAAGAVVLATSLFAVTQASADGPIVKVSSFESGVGGIGKAEVSVENISAPGIGAWTIDVHFDSSVMSGVTCVSMQGGGICNATYGDGVARVVGTNIHGLEGDAPLASIGFVCTQEGETALELSISVLVDATPGDPTDMNAKLVNGNASCSGDAPVPTPTDDSKVAGDANCDGETNALDAAIVLQFNAGLIDSVRCEDADFDHNGLVNALDAALILQKDAGLIP